jgi:hypothetical protein
MVKTVEDGARQDATGEQAPEVLVAKHEDVVEQLPPERAYEALSEGVHVRRAYGAADDLRSGGLEDRCESDTQLPITVSDQDFGLVVHRGIPGLLRAPVVGGHRGGSCVNDLAALDGQNSIAAVEPTKMPDSAGPIMAAIEVRPTLFPSS